MEYRYKDENNQFVTVSVNSLIEAANTLPQNGIIGDNFIIAWNKINSNKYKKICCTISGGSDSDIILDICTKVDINHKIEYVWFDTGMEYQATKDHLTFLEKKYNISIKRVKAIKPIPTSCKLYGQPFLSKQVSENMMRLQKYNFQWEDDTFENLLDKYCKKVPAGTKRAVEVNGTYYIGCVQALKWWCNKNEERTNGGLSQFNINWNAYLKEFIIKYPPKFKIANKCCKYAKKDVSHQIISTENYDLLIIGVRNAEGGSRAAAYKSCFDNNGVIKKNGISYEYDNYRPIFWYKNSDKKEYEDYFDVIHSDCYTKYGLTRTGCVGCPFGKDFEKELEIVKKYEPKFYKAIVNIFGDSYEYMRAYNEFRREMKQIKG